MLQVLLVAVCTGACLWMWWWVLWLAFPTLFLLAADLRSVHQQKGHPPPSTTRPEGRVESASKVAVHGTQHTQYHDQYTFMHHQCSTTKSNHHHNHCQFSFLLLLSNARMCTSAHHQHAESTVEQKPEGGFSSWGSSHFWFCSMNLLPLFSNRSYIRSGHATVPSSVLQVWGGNLFPLIIPPN